MIPMARPWAVAWMARAARCAGLAALAVAWSSPHAVAASDVAYRVTYAAPGTGQVVVTVTWGEPLAAARAFVMPRAIPMGYGEQRYDAFVEALDAVGAAGAPAARADRLEGPRWQLPAGTTAVRYRVDLARMEREIVGASDASRVREAYLGALGYSVFGYVDGFEDRAVRLEVVAPEGWPVLSTLSPQWPVPVGTTAATAADFYALADSQIVMGPRATFRRLAERPVPLFLASYAEGDVDLERVGRLIVTAFGQVAAYFGSVPFTHYTVHQELLQPLTPRHEYGMSMEHLDSSTYYLAAAAGLTSASTPQDEARTLYNYAHHIAHAWLPKRVSGEGYFPFQWELAPVIDTIWFAEGFGQYAAIMALAPATPDPAAFRAGMIERRFQRNLDEAPPFLRRMGLIDLSRVASTRYAEDFRTGRLVFSRGGLMAAAIDDGIRSRTQGQIQLRDGLRFLLAWAARERRGFTTEELAGLLRQGTGVDVADIIATWLAPLPPR
jgi:predicted metalloprotease with PDZ domain